MAQCDRCYLVATGFQRERFCRRFRTSFGTESSSRRAVKCTRIWPAHKLDKEGCTYYKVNPHWKEISPKKKEARHKLQKMLGIVMLSVLLEEILHQNLISDSTLTLPHIQCC